MNLWDRVRMLARIVHELRTWVWHDTTYPSPFPENPRFMSPRTAVGLIGDGDVVAVSGLGGNQRAAIMFWAIAELFLQHGRPRELTVVNLGGHGGRGKAPGTLEELGRPGLCRRLITGHFETFRAMLDLAAASDCELQCLPQGILALLIDALGRGEDALRSETGIGTFLDPRVGTGSPIGGRGEQLITVEGDRLCYRMPAIDVAIFNAPAADRRGNIYVDHCATIGETMEITRAATRNHGCVIANVGRIVEGRPDRIFVPAEMVDAVVYHPDTEQAAGFPHRSYWSALTPESDVAITDALAQARFASWLLGLTPTRTAVDQAVTRLAAATLIEHIERGAQVNIGTGLPEGVCDALLAAGMHDAITLLVESGPVGGLPAPGLFFGASFSPRTIISSIDMFKLCYQRLDATCLGVLEADDDGNVNVSRKSDQVRKYVGPGGFIDLTTAARTIVFVSDWMVDGTFAMESGCVRIVKRGRPKFVSRVREITFNGPRAVAAGKCVFYATPVGLFRLTCRGMELVSVMPGIDVRRDILEVASMRIVVPEGAPLSLVPRPIVTGEGFAPRLATS